MWHFNLTLSSSMLVLKITAYTSRIGTSTLGNRMSLSCRDLSLVDLSGGSTENQTKRLAFISPDEDVALPKLLHGESSLKILQAQKF